ncbi:hypothetical protein [Pseudogemmobacter sonorensis]|uniref:hypothetical protein n=1 Tax=Pseudogemmobacter sonorensis TaxID=2989681 RepID=UPI0036BBE493
MRMTLAASALVLVTALAGCTAGLIPAQSGNVPLIPAVCAEQAALATQGRTDGRDITITCP